MEELNLGQNFTSEQDEDGDFGFMSPTDDVVTARSFIDGDDSIIDNYGSSSIFLSFEEELDVCKREDQFNEEEGVL